MCDPVQTRFLWKLPPAFLLESPFAEELMLLLEKRLLMQLRQAPIEEPSPKPGSKQAVLKVFGSFRDEDGGELCIQLPGCVETGREAGGWRFGSPRV